MQTLRGFVDTVWTTDQAIHHEHSISGVWSKPDTISGNFELRRLTTSKNRNDTRTDFFEFYWAHLMEGTSAAHVAAWAQCLLRRWPWNVPPPLRGAWVLLVGLVILVAAIAVQTMLPESLRIVPVPKWVSGIGGIVVAVAAMPILKNIVGDAARYLNVAPGNVKRRQEIRSKGVELLQKLHDAGYQRIIVVGHSLGSVIGYDILTHAWALHHRNIDPASPHPVMDTLEGDIAKSQLSPHEYQPRQRELLRELQGIGNTWRVTDFLTLGSPLAHASVLLAKNEDDLKAKQAGREFPTCPPVLEKGRFSYPPDAKHRKPHHAAVFAPCRWTNLYFPTRFIVGGDFIGGPLANLFGPGVRDVQVKTGLRRGLLSHTLYWMPEKGPGTASHVVALREGVNLLDV